MRIVTMAMFLLAVNFASLMIIASGAFPVGTTPTGMEDMAGKMSNTTSTIDNPPRSVSPFDIAGGIVLAAQWLIGAVINAPTTMAYLIASAIPGEAGNTPLVYCLGMANINSAVECQFVLAVRGLMWMIYILAFISVVIRYKLED